ncbi:DNA polymerase III subunit delta' [Lichenicoccus sp.]|uniref:DNA polymerase III subunit delta' n=1 Tax=Lichenicoccus sp. TaxID=2781899 RepID=UPI003D1357B9
MSSVVGHDAAKRTLAQAFRSGRLHHAWLISGPAGIGKATLARQFAREVLAGEDEAAARRVAAGTHADLLLVSRGLDEKRQTARREIVLDDVRPVSGFLRRTAAEGGWRVVIVDDADLLNRNAANALLKLIEEPPPRALLLLVSEAPGRLLATLRSRCRSLRLAPLDDAAMDAVLRQKLPELEAAERERLMALGRGAPGRALSLAAGGGLALSGLVDALLARQDAGAGPWSYDLAEAVLRHEDGCASFLGLLSGAISTSLRDAARAGTMPRETLLALRSPPHWAEVCAGLITLRDETGRLALDRRQAVLSALTLLGTS